MCVFLLIQVILSQVVQRDDPAVPQLPIQVDHLLLLHLGRGLHHFQGWVVMVTILYCLQLFCESLLEWGQRPQEEGNFFFKSCELSYETYFPILPRDPKLAKVNSCGSFVGADASGGHPGSRPDHLTSLSPSLKIIYLHSRGSL